MFVHYRPHVDRHLESRWHRDLQWSLSTPRPLITQPLIHLRRLDLMHLNIADDAVDGIIANALEVRNLALAKGTARIDKAVKNICESASSL